MWTSLIQSYTLLKNIQCDDWRDGNENFKKSNKEGLRVVLFLHSTQCDVCGAPWCLDSVLETRFCKKMFGFRKV
jgi:hypothetical protein